MDENKITEIQEESTKVYVDAKTDNIETKEESQDIAVQIATPLNLEVEDENIIDVAMSEAFPFITSGICSSGTIDHSVLNGRELNEQHPISAISGLRDELDDIKAVKRTYSSESGLSEFRKWNDGNPSMEDRAGYFVKLVTGTDNIDICTDKDDVYGVTVINSGFVGNQIQSDKSDDPSYSMVGIAGALRVRTDGTARNGEYVVPDSTGIATFSENGCGYKVISQGSYSTYPYVTIAVTPQNDKLSKVYGMLTEADGTLGNLVIRIEDVEDKANNASQKADIIISDNESIKEIINENKQNIEQISNISNSAYEAAQEAKESVSSVVTSANEAMKKAQEAALEAQNAANDLANAMDIVNDMEPLVSFESGDYKGAAGIVAIATEYQMNFGPLMQTVTEQGSDLAAAILKSDENGVAIQNLVSHVDKYSAGQYSTSYGLSKDNAKSILVDNYIYVPTVDHTETMYIRDEIIEDEVKEITEEIAFARGYSYEWDNENGTWVQGQAVSLTTTYKDGTQEGDLWLCWQDVEVLDENGELAATYISGTLYRWFGSKWIAVASVADNAQSRMLTTSTQTADDFTQSVNNSTGEGSTVKQKFDSILSTVSNNKGYISAIEQTAESIRAGTYTESGNASQLELLVSDTDSSLNAVTAGRFHIMYQSYLGAAPDVYEDGNKYSKMPTWDEKLGIFVFNDAFIDNTDGIYYFYSDDHTKYCKVVDGGYEIYTIGNKATSLLNSRINSTEAILSGSVEYATENSQAFAGIVQKANENSVKIDYVTSYYYHTLLSISETEIPVYGDYKYSSPPTWNPQLGKYEFDIANRDNENGIYYLIDADGTTYCKVVTTGDGSNLYEIYGLAGSYMASISQGADENGGYIQSMVMDIERYNVGQYSPSYGMSYDDAVATIPKGTMYVSTVAHSENLIPDERVGIDKLSEEQFNAGTLTERESDNDLVQLNTTPFDALEVSNMQTYDFEVEDDKTYSYEWTGLEWQKSDTVSLSTEYFDYDGTENTSKLWYCTQDVTNAQEIAAGQNGVYKEGTLYAWHGERWFAIATINDNLLSRSLSLVRQTANSYSIELRNIQGDFSQYKQTVNSIGLLVQGSDGSSGKFNVTKEGLVGEVYNRTGNSATLKAQADTTQAVLDLMISGLYHKLEQPLTDNVPEPYGTWGKYSVRPEWSASLGKFVFDVRNESEDGIYYFFDEDETHYCKVVGDQYEVYTIGTLSTAGTDAHITEEYANINTLAYYGDNETSTIAGLRNLALEGKAQIQLLASLDENKLDRVVNIYGYTLDEETKRYAQKPTYIDGAYTFDGQVEDTDGEYFLINSQQFGKLIINSKGSCYGYEVYTYDSNSTAGLVGTVLDNKAKIGMIVDVNGVKGGVVVEAINDQSEVKIYGDKLDIKGITTVSNSSGSSTVIDGSYITTGNIKSNNYSYSSGYFSTSGTQFNLTDGAITSENFAIDSEGNLYLKGDISATNARIKGGLSVGSADGKTYNFTVDAYGNVEVKGILNATDLRIDGTSILTTINSTQKIKSNYLDLGNIILDGNTGNITLGGNIYITGNIEWNSSNSPVSVQYSITGNSWHDDYQSTDYYARYSYDGGKTWTNAIKIQGEDGVDGSDANVSEKAIFDILTNGGTKFGIFSDSASNKLYINANYIKAGVLDASIIELSGTDSNGYFYGLYPYIGSNGKERTRGYKLSSTKNGSGTGSLFVTNSGVKMEVSNSNEQSAEFYVSIGKIFASDTIDQSSDRRIKKSIDYNMDKYEPFFMSLKPASYQMISGTSQKYHVGYIAQDVRDALFNNNLNTNDFDGLYQQQLEEPNKYGLTDMYTLGYTEFIALNTHMIQKLYTKIDELENKIQQLEKASTETE